MRTLLCTTSLTTVLILATAPADAQTREIDSAITTPVATATADDGAPADIEITKDGSVKPQSGTAVKMNSANDVSNAGTIQITDADDAVGIDVTASGSGTINNSGKIIIDESYEAKDADDDDDLDGPLAEGSGRFGIRTNAAFTGDIVNSGEITVEGNDSAGIALGGPLTGSLTSSGKVTLTGNDTVAIRAGDVSGDVSLTGAISAQGENAVGVALDGDVGGAVTIQGSVSTTGYRYTSPPSDTEDLDSDDLLQGGPAVRIAGNVAGGVLLDAPPADTDPDEDDEDGDGIDDADEGTASIISYGAAPALEIGSATKDITLSAVDGDAGDHGLVIRGQVGAGGVYDGIDATAIAIGGTGNSVDLDGGLSVAGTVAAGSAADATAVRLGSGTIAPDIDVSGKVDAQGGSDAANVTRAISIESGAEVAHLSNSGTISAETGGSGTAVAIYDGAGTLGQIENTGIISASGATKTDGQMIALDLRANGSGATVEQMLADEDASAPQIKGDVLFGDGGDSFDVAAGSVSGTVDFGAGANEYALSGNATQSGAVVFGSGADQLSLAGTSKLVGDVDFGGGTDTLAMAEGTVFRGGLSNSAGLAANVSGTLAVTNTGTISLASLNVGETGAIGVNIDGAEGTSTLYQIAGGATFAEGARVLVQLSDIKGSIGDHVIIDAGTLTGGDTLASSDIDLPFLFKSDLSADEAAGTVTLSVDRKSATDLGMNRSEAGAYDAVFNALDSDEQVADVFLNIGDAESFYDRYRTFLPEHAGGLFESVTLASRSAGRFLEDRQPEDNGRWNVFMEQVGWGTSKDVGDTAAYDIDGWGATGAAEHAIGGAGYLGFSLGFALGRDGDGSNGNEITTGQYEAGVHWRARFGGLGLAARGTIGTVDFHGQRRFDAADFSRVSKSKWSGMLYSATGSASYDLRVGKRLRLRPTASIDYYRLTEDAHTDTGGGEAFDLAVEKRTSDELAASGTLSLGYELASLDPTETWLRLELEGGRREIVGGEIGSTTARFGDGDPFTLDPAERRSGWLGRVRLSGGQNSFALSGEVGAEEQQDHTAIAARMTVRIGW